MEKQPATRHLRDFPHMEQVRKSAQKRHAHLILVGGAVRDALLGLIPHDLDFAVMGNPIAVGRDVAGALGGAFYVMDETRHTARVILNKSDPYLEMDFAMCRGETWEQDLRARDFSINAIGLDIFSGDLIDPLNGAEDVRQRVVRMVSETALTDDAVRVLRATRMALSLGATIEPFTRAAAQAAAPRLAAANGPSPERVRDELMAILALPNAADGVWQAEDLSWLTFVLPEASPVSAGVFGVLQNLDGILARPDPAPINKKAETRLAALLAHLEPHEVEKRCRALKLSRQEVDAVRTIAEESAKWGAKGDKAPDLREMYWLAQAAGEFSAEVAALAAAQNPSCANAAREFARVYAARFAASVAPAPLVAGQDALALGVSAGPRVGVLLAQVREAQMMGEIATREQALALLATLVS